jgi:hypothetical protein
MLKRKGEFCQHEVPGYPGLLTASEYKAYNNVVERMKEDFENLNYWAGILVEFEKQIPRLIKLAERGIPRNAETITMLGTEIWQVFDTFCKVKNHGDLLFCTRQAASGTEFCVIVKCPVGSPQRFELFGKTIDRYYHTRGTSPSLVLANFLDRERYGFEITEKRRELEIAEYLSERSERYDPDVCRRVCKAVAPLFKKQPTTELKDVSIEKPSAGMKMKL